MGLGSLRANLVWRPLTIDSRRIFPLRTGAVGGGLSGGFQGERGGRVPKAARWLGVVAC
jgi:hypothetical protein